MKKVAILWTSGLDSTYLLIKNLFLGNKVDAFYINFMNNPNEMKAEEIARKKIFKDIKKLYKCIDIQGMLCSSIEKLSNIELTYGEDYVFPQVPLFFPAILSIMTSYDEIQLGFLYNDYGYVEEFTRRLANIYEEYVDLAKSGGDELNNVKIAELKFPLTQTTKQEEILFFQNLDSKYKTNFLDNMIHCEQVVFEKGKFTNCGHCPACKNYKKAFNSLSRKE